MNVNDVIAKALKDDYSWEHEGNTKKFIGFPRVKNGIYKAVIESHTIKNPNTDNPVPDFRFRLIEDYMLNNDINVNIFFTADDQTSYEFVNKRNEQNFNKLLRACKCLKFDYIHKDVIGKVVYLDIVNNKSWSNVYDIYEEPPENYIEATKDSIYYIQNNMPTTNEKPTKNSNFTPEKYKNENDIEEDLEDEIPF